jgi:hypothetical protein
MWKKIEAAVVALNGYRRTDRMIKESENVNCRNNRWKGVAE